MIKLHVEEGSLHPYVGLILFHLVGKGDAD